MSKYKFSTKSKVIRVLMYVLISLLVSFVGVSVYLYFNPVEGDYKKAGYFKTSNDAYNTILAKGDLKSFDKGVLEVSYTTYISSFEKKENGVDLSSMMINTKDGIESLIISLPKNEAFDKSFGEAEGASGYVTLNLKFAVAKDFKDLYTSYCNLLKLGNCSRNISISSWEMKKVSEDIDYSEVSKGVVRWLTTRFDNIEGDRLSYKFIQENNLDKSIWISDFLEGQPGYNYYSSKIFVALSNSWNQIRDDEKLLLRSIEYIHNIFATLQKRQPNSTFSVSCGDVVKFRENIKTCGEVCSSKFDTEFISRYEQLCEDDTAWRNLELKASSGIETFVDLNKDLGHDRITPYGKLVDSEITNFSRMSTITSSYMDYAYWLYNRSSVQNKKELLSNAYRVVLEKYALYGRQYFGVCQVGKVALDYYFYSKEQKYLDDATYILTNGSILGNNVLFADSAVPYSSMVLGESVACMEFTNRFSKIVTEGSEALSSMTNLLLRDRVLRSWDMIGYAGHVENVYDGGFYDFDYIQDKSSNYIYFMFDNLSILNVISSLL